MSVAQEIEALERRGWEALSGTEGAEFYLEHMANDGLMVFPGMVLDKPASIEAITGAQPWATFSLADIRVITGADAGIVTYHATAQREGDDPYRAWMSSTYVRRDGRWQLVLHQQSPDPK